MFQTLSCGGVDQIGVSKLLNTKIKGIIENFLLAETMFSSFNENDRMNV